MNTRRYRGANAIGTLAISDAKLCELLAEVGNLSAEEVMLVVECAQWLSEEKGRMLNKADRDKLMALAMREKLLKPPPKRNRGIPRTDDPRGEALLGLCHATAQTAEARKLIASQVPALGGRMPVPPNRRAS